MESDFTEEQLEEIKKIFQHFDKDKDGKLTANELGILMRSFEQSPTEAEVQDIIKEIDQSGNDAIDYTEFLSLLSSSLKQPCSDDDYMQVFNVYDSDGNGVISAEEFRAIMQSMGDSMTKEEAEEMILEADRDGDGQINREEFISMMREKT